MPDLWRIGKHRDLSGEGGRRASARWHRAGRPIVYLAESAAGALLEVLVHLELDPAALPTHYTLLRVNAAPGFIPESLPLSGDSWRTDIEVSRDAGDQWLMTAATALVRVPSIILPNTWNVLLNPLHADAAMVEITGVETVAFDPRLLRTIGF